MNISELEELLKNYKYHKLNISNIDADIEFIKSDYDTVGSITYDKVGGTSGDGKYSSIEDHLLNKEYQLKKLYRRKSNANYTLSKLDTCLEQLPEIERDIVHSKLIEGNTWVKVAYEVCYGERHCKRLLGKGLETLSLCMGTNFIEEVS